MAAPVWDLILVDCAAGGQVESHLACGAGDAHAGQGRRDPRAGRVDRCADPRPEAHHRRAVRAARGDAGHRGDRAARSDAHGIGVAVDVCILNRAATEPVTPAHRRFIALLRPRVRGRGVDAAGRLTRAPRGRPRPRGSSVRHQPPLRALSCAAACRCRSSRSRSIVERPGLTTTRAVADALGGRLG